MRKINRHGELLTENVIFIILNIVFIVILFLFLFMKTGSAAVLEEKYAKQIALIIDSAEPGMVIYIDMEDAIKIAQKEGRDLNKDVVVIDGNIVKIQLREKGGYVYSYFNNVEASVNFDSESRQKYFLVIDKK
mgnify:FL=1